MKLRIEDLRIGDSVEVNFTGKVYRIENCPPTGKTIFLENKDGLASVMEGHLAEVMTPEDLRGDYV